MQDIFRSNRQRLCHWVENRDLPTDKNRAERELRPTVIARKTSFGSPSDAGAKTREVQDPIAWLFPNDSSVCLELRAL